MPLSNVSKLGTIFQQVVYRQCFVAADTERLRDENGNKSGHLCHESHLTLSQSHHTQGRSKMNN